MILLVLICAASGAYQLLALVACMTHLLRRDRASQHDPRFLFLSRSTEPTITSGPQSSVTPGSSIPSSRFSLVYATAAILRSLLFRGSSWRPPATHPSSSLHDRRSKREGWFADRPCTRGAIFDCVVNDSDIVVDPDYLDKVTAPLEDAHVGLVTCLYRAGADSFAAKWEALGIATDFVPSALVAPLVGVNEYGLGSTLAFRKGDLEAIGGFEPIADYVADDYQLGKRISQSGKKVRLLRMPVETHLGAGSWKSVWDHQVRWARTIRLSRGAYLGLPITNASLWALIALLFGWSQVAISLLALRTIVGLVAGLAVVHDPITSRYWWLMPLRDMWGFGVWTAGAGSGEVVWRGKKLRLDREGRIVG